MQNQFLVLINNATFRFENKTKRDASAVNKRFIEASHENDEITIFK